MRSSVNDNDDCDGNCTSGGAGRASGATNKDGKFGSQSRSPRRTATSTSSRTTLTAEELAIVKTGARVHGDQGRSRSSTSTGPTTHFRSSCCRRSRSCSSAASACRATAAPAEARSCSASSPMEMARVDASFATFFGVHSGLAMGSIYLDGSEEQKQKWLPPMARLEKIGCFGLTEPLVGSGTSGGLTDDRQARGRHLDPQWPEAVDRQRAVVRRLDHLGARSRRQSGQGLHRREQDHARLQRREDREQDRAQGGPERPDHAEGRAGAGGEPPAGRQLVPRHRAGAADDAVPGRLGGDRMPDGRLSRRRSNTPRSDCSSASRSARSSWCRTCSPRCSPTSPPASA